MKDINKEFKLLETKLEAANERGDGYKKEKEASKKNGSDAEKENDELKESAANAEKENDLLKKDIKRIRKDRNDLLDRKKSSEDSKIKMEAEILSLKAEVSTLTDKLHSPSVGEQDEQEIPSPATDDKDSEVTNSEEDPEYLKSS